MNSRGIQWKLWYWGLKTLALRHYLKSISECCPAWYPRRIAHHMDLEIDEFYFWDQNFLCARMYGSNGYNKKKLSIQQPYWRKFLTCKWNLSFFICDQTENNMQLFHKILVLHVHTWFYIPNELQLHNKYVPNLKDHQILTHLHNRSSESNCAFFGKIWSLKIDKIVRITFKKDLSCSVFVCFQYLTTLCKS